MKGWGFVVVLLQHIHYIHHIFHKTLKIAGMGNMA